MTLFYTLSRAMQPRIFHDFLHLKHDQSKRLTISSSHSLFKQYICFLMVHKKLKICFNTYIIRIGRAFRNVRRRGVEVCVFCVFCGLNPIAAKRAATAAWVFLCVFCAFCGLNPIAAKRAATAAWASCGVFCAFCGPDASLIEQRPGRLHRTPTRSRLGSVRNATAHVHGHT